MTLPESRRGYTGQENTQSPAFLGSSWDNGGGTLPTGDAALTVTLSGAGTVGTSGTQATTYVLLHATSASRRAAELPPASGPSSRCPPMPRERLSSRTTQTLPSCFRTSDFNFRIPRYRWRYSMRPTSRPATLPLWVFRTGRRCNPGEPCPSPARSSCWGRPLSGCWVAIGEGGVG